MVSGELVDSRERWGSDPGGHDFLPSRLVTEMRRGERVRVEG